MLGEKNLERCGQVDRRLSVLKEQIQPLSMAANRQSRYQDESPTTHSNILRRLIDALSINTFFLSDNYQDGAEFDSIMTTVETTLSAVEARIAELCKAWGVEL